MISKKKWSSSSFIQKWPYWLWRPWTSSSLSRAWSSSRWRNFGDKKPHLSTPIFCDKTWIPVFRFKCWDKLWSPTMRQIYLRPVGMRQFSMGKEIWMWHKILRTTFPTYNVLPQLVSLHLMALPKWCNIIATNAVETYFACLIRCEATRTYVFSPS